MIKAKMIYNGNDCIEFKDQKIIFKQQTSND